MHFELTDRGGDMLSKEYLDTAQTLRRVARNMIDQAIVNRLEALVEDYERRAEKASLADSAEALARPAPRSETREEHARVKAADVERMAALWRRSRASCRGSEHLC
jgi:hypothetical protein